MQRVTTGLDYFLILDTLSLSRRYAPLERLRFNTEPQAVVAPESRTPIRARIESCSRLTPS
jgi:hypothetical protein